MNTDLLFKEESYKIVGACFEVYREKGCGFLEPVYQECMEIELRLQGIPYVAQRPLALEYKRCPLRSKYEPDFICYGKIIVESKLKIRYFRTTPQQADGAFARKFLLKAAKPRIF